MSIRQLSIALPLAVAMATAAAQTSVTDLWARATVPGQKAGGAFARITSAQGGTLVAARSPVAGAVEIHEMAMQGTTMTMRALPSGLALPAGRAVELKPGGLHFMLLDLKQPLVAGARVPLELDVVAADGRRETLTLQAEVRPLGAAATDHGGHKH